MADRRRGGRGGRGPGAGRHRAIERRLRMRSRRLPGCATSATALPTPFSGRATIRRRGRPTLISWLNRWATRRSWMVSGAARSPLEDFEAAGINFHDAQANAGVWTFDIDGGTATAIDQPKGPDCEGTFSFAGDRISLDWSTPGNGHCLRPEHRVPTSRDGDVVHITWETQRDYDVALDNALFSKRAGAGGVMAVALRNATAATSVLTGAAAAVVLIGPVPASPSPGRIAVAAVILAAALVAVRIRLRAAAAGPRGGRCSLRRPGRARWTGSELLRGFAILSAPVAMVLAGLSLGRSSRSRLGCSSSGAGWWPVRSAASLTIPSSRPRARTAVTARWPFSRTPRRP